MITTSKMSLDAGPGSGRVQLGSALLIRITDPTAQASIPPNRMIDARSPFTSKCAIAQIFTEISIGWRQ